MLKEALRIEKEKDQTQAYLLMKQRGVPQMTNMWADRKDNGVSLEKEDGFRRIKVDSSGRYSRSTH